MYIAALYPTCLRRKKLIFSNKGETQCIKPCLYIDFAKNLFGKNKTIYQKTKSDVIT